MPDHELLALLHAYEPSSAVERDDVARVIELATRGGAWSRTSAVHVTGSGLIVHPPTRRILLRWHERQGAWLHVGGHGDPGERHPLVVALREAEEETGLEDLRPWPTDALRQVVIVAVPARAEEPAHHHADLRYFLETDEPDSARPEGDDAPLRWLAPSDAAALTTEANVREMIRRATDLLDG
jgi:8-oxo-dGTP pyrophosphatase MutT (NUDIX family)